MNPQMKATRRGMERGLKLAMDPTPENFQRLRSRKADTVTAAWQSTGRQLREAMKQEAVNSAKSR